MGVHTAPERENSSLSLAVDNGPGLLVTSWIANGSNLLQTADAYLEASGGGHVRSVRLYPTSLADKHTRNIIRQASYRAVFDVSTPNSATRVFDPNVNAWQNIDQNMYGEIAVDDIIFKFDSSGRAEYIIPRVLRSILAKVHA